jgi:hypothetical protein
MAGFQQGYALIIGVANYPNVRPLPSSVLDDARAVSAMLQRPDRAGYPQDNVRLLLDKDATKLNIMSGLGWLASSVGADSTAVVFFSGHGGKFEDATNKGNYLIPYDTRLNAVKQTAISSDELTAALRAIPSSRVVVMLDACHSGGTGDPKDLDPNNAVFKGGLEEAAYDQLKQGSGRVVIASSRSSEVSWVLPGAKNSLFTQCVLEAMDGQAKQSGDGMLRIFDLVNYLFEQVPARKPEQHPIFKVSDLDANFAVSLFLGGSKDIAPAQISSGKLEITIHAAPRVNSSDLVSLRDFMANNMTPDDMDMLCEEVNGVLQSSGFNQKFSMDIVTSTRKPFPNQVQDALLWLNRRAKLPVLVEAIKKKFPGEIS